MPVSILDLSKETQDAVIDRAVLRGQKNGECIEWAGARDKHGYALISPPRSSMIRLHRAICEVTHGRMSSRQVAMHRCDNPRCIHPAHLRPGTNSENQADMTRKGRGRVGTRNGRAKLTEQDVRQIIVRRRAGESPYTLADEFGVDVIAVQRIMRGEIWQHIAIDRSRTPAMNHRRKRVAA